MTNDEILDRWHEAELAYLQASHTSRPEATFAKMAAEQAAIDRFGVGLHVRAYRTRFKGDEPGE